MAAVTLPVPEQSRSAEFRADVHKVTLPPGDHVIIPRSESARMITFVPTACDGGVYATGDLEAQIMRAGDVSAARLVEQTAIYRKPTALDGAAGSVGYVAIPAHDLAIINTTGGKTITIVIGVHL